MVEKLAPRFGLDAKLVLSVIQTESAYRQDAVSPRNARGTNGFGAHKRTMADASIRPCGPCSARWMGVSLGGRLALALPRKRYWRSCAIVVLTVSNTPKALEVLRGESLDEF